MAERLARALRLLLLGACAAAAEPAPPVTDATARPRFRRVRHADARGGRSAHRHAEGRPARVAGPVGRRRAQMDHRLARPRHAAAARRRRTGVRQHGGKPARACGTPRRGVVDLVAGGRVNTGSGPSRGYAAVGGSRPAVVSRRGYGLSRRGRVGLRLQGDYDWLITNRFCRRAWRAMRGATTMSAPAVLPSLPPDCGCAMMIRREFAPYVGMEWHGLYRRYPYTRLVAGLRFWARAARSSSRRRGASDTGGAASFVSPARTRSRPA